MNKGSAATAKERAKWCVQANRNGGYWVESAWQYMDFWFLGQDKPGRIPTVVCAYRWVYA